MCPTSNVCLPGTQFRRHVHPDLPTATVNTGLRKPLELTPNPGQHAVYGPLDGAHVRSNIQLFITQQLLASGWSPTVLRFVSLAKHMQSVGRYQVHQKEEEEEEEEEEGDIWHTQQGGDGRYWMLRTLEHSSWAECSSTSIPCL